MKDPYDFEPIKELPNHAGVRVGNNWFDDLDGVIAVSNLGTEEDDEELSKEEMDKLLEVKNDTGDVAKDSVGEVPS